MKKKSRFPDSQLGSRSGTHTRRPIIPDPSAELESNFVHSFSSSSMAQRAIRPRHIRTEILPAHPNFHNREEFKLPDVIRFLFSNFYPFLPLCGYRDSFFSLSLCPSGLEVSYGRTEGEKGGAVFPRTILRFLVFV